MKGQHNETINSDPTFPSTAYVGADNIAYEAYQDRIDAGDLTVEQAYMEIVQKYGGGAEVAQWPKSSIFPSNDKAQGIVFQTPMMPIDKLHEHSFFVWEPYEKDDLEIIVKTYAFWVPEDDPSRDPIVQVFSYQVDWKEKSFSQGLYYDFLYTHAPYDNSDIIFRSRGNVTRRSVSPFTPMYQDLLIKPQTHLILDENFEGNHSVYYSSVNQEIVFQESGTIYASEVDISANLRALPGVEVTIIALNIDVNVTSNVGPGINLAAMRADGYSNKAEYADIHNICISKEYTDRQRRLERRSKPEEEQVSSSISARLFPNPTRTQSTLRYELKEDAQVRISLIDVLGQENILLNSSQAAGTQELLIDLSDYPAGLYYCRLTVDGEQQALPLRVQR